MNALVNNAPKQPVTIKTCHIMPLGIDEANKFVLQFHRHNKKVAGAKFAIGLQLDSELIGVAIAGRPLARAFDNGRTIEILRVCVKNGYKNANSILYGRMKRICQVMGYEKLITYTLRDESGSSPKAIGMKGTPIAPHTWNRPQRNRPFQQIYSKKKIRWELQLDTFSINTKSIRLLDSLESPAREEPSK